MTLNSSDPDLVNVYWHDACNIAEWMDDQEIVEEFRDNPSRWECQSVGWLIYEDEHCIVVAARRGEKTWGLSERIPKSIVTKIDIVESTASADKSELTKAEEPINPPDCTCEFVHRSEPTCPSKAPSRGAILDAPA